jgi:hypothetical protein
VLSVLRKGEKTEERMMDDGMTSLEPNIILFTPPPRGGAGGTKIWNVSMEYT